MPTCARQSSRPQPALADRLIHHMGFEALDVASMIAQPATLPLFGGDGFEPNQSLQRLCSKRR